MSESKSDREFYITFGWVTVIIVGLAIFIAILSNMFAAGSHPDHYKKQKEQLKQSRLAPSEKINLASNPTFKPKVTKVASAPQSGEAVYNSVCMSCHMSGAAGAPVTGEATQWTQRLTKGLDTLYSNALNGIGVMPAKGGLMSLSEKEIKLAVDYMLDKSK